MKDNVLNNFIDKLLKEDINQEKFAIYIDLVSRFLGYTNSDYKYNGTFLGQYISDFVQFYQMLRKKNDKYHEIFISLTELGQQFELLVDKSFLASFTLKHEMNYEYIAINKSKIVSEKLEIRFKMESGNEEYVFCKEYEDFKQSKISEIICNDVRKYIQMKKIGRVDNETS